MRGSGFGSWLRVVSCFLFLVGMGNAQSLSTFSVQPSYSQVPTIYNSMGSQVPAVGTQLDPAAVQTMPVEVQDFHSAQQFQPQEFAPQHSGTGGQFPIGRVTFEGFAFSRPGVGGDHPLILDDVNPFGDPLVTSDDLSIETEVGTQVSFELGGFYMSYMTSGSNNTTIESESNPADINWFNASALEPANRYFTVYTSVLRLGDLGVRRQVNAGTDLYFGLAIGRLKETMDLLESFNPKNGFYSYAENEFYGGHLGIRKQLFNNGNFRIEALGRGGLYYNSMEVNAVARNFEGFWNDDSFAYSGLGNISVVIPAWPINFRIGYQLMLLGGIITPQQASATLNSFDLSDDDIETGEVVYHGLTFGVEKLW